MRSDLAVFLLAASVCGVLVGIGFAAGVAVGYQRRREDWVALPEPPEWLRGQDIIAAEIQAAAAGPTYVLHLACGHRISVDRFTFERAKSGDYDRYECGECVVHALSQ